jgi:hypothetical protein
MPLPALQGRMDPIQGGLKCQLELLVRFTLVFSRSGLSSRKIGGGDTCIDRGIKYDSRVSISRTLIECVLRRLFC